MSAMTTARVCAVSGGTRGIGLEIASWLASEGASVAICSRQGAEASRVAARLAEQYGVAVVGSACDVSVASEVDRWIEEVMRTFGRLDVAVANAAILGPVGPLAAIDMDAWAGAVNVDVVGVAAVVRAALRPMLAAGSGRIIIVSGGGIGGPNPIVNTSAYAVSKAAVTVLAEVVGVEVAGSGVTVNTISPGRVPTDFMHPVLEAGEDVAGAALYRIAQDGTPADLGRLRDLVLYLASTESGWLSGRCVSARRDDPASLEEAREAIQAGSRLQLRRVDGALYREFEAVP